MHQDGDGTTQCQHFALFLSLPVFVVEGRGKGEGELQVRKGNYQIHGSNKSFSFRFAVGAASSQEPRFDWIARPTKMLCLFIFCFLLL